MRKPFILISLLGTLLCGCTLTNIEDKSNEDVEEIYTEEEEEHEEHQEEHTDGPYLSLDSWQEYTFVKNNKPSYHDDWDYYYGTTYEPSGQLWENSNYKQYSGIEFSDKKQYMVSPLFNSYIKLEIRFNFWFSSHESTKYKGVDGEPTFKLESYDDKDTLLGTTTFEFKRSDIPSNNTVLQKQLYVYQTKMNYFILKFNNFITNGSSGYTPIINAISLKGWNYN